MKKALLMTMFLGVSLQSAQVLAGERTLPQRSAMAWSCSGKEIMSEDSTNFIFVMEDHDGEKYQYIAMTEVTFDGVSSPDIDLTKSTVECGGKTDEGQVRIGPQSWSLVENQFHMSSGCENETIEIEATCEPQF